jgi:signal transduction histidine kinase
LNLSPFQPGDQLKRRRIDPASLQFRLALGVTALSVLGLSGVASWASWKMQQILVHTHSENVRDIAERFPRDVELYSDMLPMQAGVQQAIDNLASPNLLFWVTSPTDDRLAQSQALKTEPQPFVDRLLSLSDMPLEPRVHRIGQRYFVLCSSPLYVEGRSIGRLYLAQDITADQLKLTGAVRDLSLVLSMLVIATVIAIGFYIRQALRPLRGMSQIAGTISANDLSQARLSLQHAPTEVRELAETLNEMLSRLGRSWEQQKQLIGDISHELRTPLSVAYGSLQAIQRRNATLSEMQQEMLDTAVSETHRTIQLLEDLLDLARADSGCMYMHSETLVLNDLVADLVEMTKRLNDRTIEVKSDQDKIWITTDRNCLNQILTNLIDNAVKYSACNQPILVKLSQTPEQTIIQVQDSGCGIPLEQQGRIFDRFYRIDNARSRATGGTGLGLAIVKTLVDGMQGQITVWSEPGVGSIFTVKLPSQLKG